MSKSIVASATSRCCHQLQLAKRFSSALSIGSSSIGSPTRVFSTGALSSTRMSHPLIATSTQSTSILASANNNTIIDSDFIRRSMATNRKVIDAKNARRLKIQQKKKKNTTKPAAAAAEPEEDEKIPGKNDPFLQHQEWVKFQQSITVEGFQTGQTTTATALKKSRGGKQARRKREKELARLGALQPQEENLSAVAQKFPAIRYSPEETDELLKLAYATLPERTGKRGTRNLKRQAERWRRVRKIRSDYKANIEEAHYRRMEARSYKRERTKTMKEASVEIRRRDLEYQKNILQKWVENMGDSALSKTSDDSP